MPWSTPSAVEDLLLYRMSKIVSLGGGLVTRLCEGQFGITRREWAVLGVLATSENLDWPELLRRTELDDARLSRAVSSLVGKRLALKTQKAGRQFVVALSEEGRRLHEQIFPQAREINRQILEGLDTQALDSLDKALIAIHEHAERLARTMVWPKASRRLGRGRTSE